MPNNACSLLDWGVATKKLAGQTVSGDLHLVEPFANGVLVAVVDGLGHGLDASVAARAAVTTLKTHAGLSVLDLIRLCHEALHGTRSVVMSLASFDAVNATMTWLGVGNVEGVLLPREADTPAESVLLRGGVVGYHLPPLRASVVPVHPGDTLIFATDGIRSDFRARPAGNETPQQLADRLLAQFNRGNDDALVLVARWQGNAI